MSVATKYDENYSRFAVARSAMHNFIDKTEKCINLTADIEGMLPMRPEQFVAIIEGDGGTEGKVQNAVHPYRVSYNNYVRLASLLNGSIEVTPANSNDYAMLTRDFSHIGIMTPDELEDMIRENIQQ